MFSIPILVNIYRNQKRVTNLFSCLASVQPAKLYIFQDGYTSEGIKKDLDACLSFAKSLISWPCEIKTMRLNDDIGPAAAEFFAYKWMFTYETMGIILEDDLVPHISFFGYCEKMLRLYENNFRVSYISGTNPYGVFKTSSDYFFSTRGSLYGWATWKRFIDSLDTKYSWLDYPNIKKIMISRCCDRFTYKSIVKKSKLLKEKQTPDFEVMVCVATVVNGQFAVIPKYNLVENRGVDASSQNGAKTLFLMPKSDQKTYFAQTYNFPDQFIEPLIIAEEPNYRKVYDHSLVARLSKKASLLFRRFAYALFMKKRS